MAGHTIKVSAVDTVEEATNTGFIWGKMHTKQSMV